jgi:hypothetical protein
MPHGDGRVALRCLVWVETPDASAADRLDEAELARWEAFREPADRDRFATGAVLVRRALRVATGDEGAVPRSRTAGSGWSSPWPWAPHTSAWTSNGCGAG